MERLQKLELQRQTDDWIGGATHDPIVGGRCPLHLQNRAPFFEQTGTPAGLPTGILGRIPTGWAIWSNGAGPDDFFDQESPEDWR
jgi:hypothetical protein